MILSVIIRPMSKVQNARVIADALGGIPQLARVCGVQYRLAYGYVERDSIPAHFDVQVVAALKEAGSDIDLLDIAIWRATSRKNDRDCHPVVQGHEKEARQ